MSEELKNYDSSTIETLDWYTHIRTRPGMYIGYAGDGSMPDDGLYVLVKEVIDNSIDEYASGFGKEIIITVDGRRVTVRDFGRGVPLEKVVDVSSKLMTGGKFDSGVFKKSVGLNGIGIKAVNATSIYFQITSYRDGKFRSATYSKGILDKDESGDSGEKNGTMVSFIADDSVFHNYSYNMEFIETMVRNYAYLNTGLTLKLNGTVYHSANGLLDLVNETMAAEPLYPPIHLKGEDIECVITHGDSNGENIASFVNGQNTTQGGTHLAAFREAVAKTVKEHFKKDFEPSDVRQSIVGAISIRVNEPGFGNQTKTKLSSKDVRPGLSVRSFIGDFVEEELDNYLHKHPETASVMLKKIQASEKERKAISGLQKNLKEKVKKASLCNKKLRDCRVHYTDSRNELSEQSSIFITEGDSASGSITKIRDVNTQAVFSLRGKPLNCVQKSEKEVRENEELLLLKAPAQGCPQRGRGHGQPPLQQDYHRHRCRRGRHAHPPADGQFLPQILPGAGASGTCLHPSDPPVQSLQQEAEHLLLQRGGERVRCQGDRFRCRDHTLQGSRRDLARRVQGLYRREHETGPGPSGHGRQHISPASVLHGKEYHRQTVVYPSESAF